MIVTADEFNVFMDNGLSSADLAIVRAYAPVVDRLIKKYLGYNVEQQTYTQFLPDFNVQAQTDALITGAESLSSTSARNVLRLPQLPVRSITSVHENANAWASDPPDFASSYLVPAGSMQLDTLDAGISWTGNLIRLSGAWLTTERSVRVVYVAGLTAEELAGDDYAEFKGAAYITLQTWLNAIKMQRFNASTGGSPGIVTSESIDGWSQSIDAGVSAKLYGFMRQLPPAAAQMLEDRVSYEQYFGN